jgi:hypothetical protein
VDSFDRIFIQIDPLLSRFLHITPSLLLETASRTQSDVDELMAVGRKPIQYGLRHLPW